ncbi:hypothetical protein F7R14_21260 [Pseudomonas lini]|uniref:Uncharacterized protein n=1 Tax=Pseudomonas lini TaxID=163011 RepID=A0A7V7TKR6_9PSED|nr:hypothetical protein F7R14_21260 [Pseudomonas lini]MDT9676809.1 hypothetical protein [Pseudomonas sp. JV414]
MRYHCRSCRRLRSFDLDCKKQDQKIAAFGSSYEGRAAPLLSQNKNKEPSCSISARSPKPMPSAGLHS